MGGGTAPSADEIVRYLRRAGLKARALASNRQQLPTVAPASLAQLAQAMASFNVQTSAAPLIPAAATQPQQTMLTSNAIH